ncbi:MAG: hypothetical protein IIX80_01055, partial [Clostridia bacterium]|nr:hypothetical protein [Clostridia bacterium]
MVLHSMRKNGIIRCRKRRIVAKNAQKVKVESNEKSKSQEHFTTQSGNAPRESAFRGTKRMRTAREHAIAPPQGGAGGGRGALLAVRRRRNNPGVSLLLTFLFAPAVSKRKVAMGAEKQSVYCFRANNV